jgi:hypothetical protein
MPKSSSAIPSVRSPRRGNKTSDDLTQLMWRLDRLERQVRKLSELVRDHAEDEDRLVRIVAEDREILRRQLVHQHQARLRLRRRDRADS